MTRRADRPPQASGAAGAVPLTPQQRRFMLALQARLAMTPDVSPTYEELRGDLGLASKSGIARLVRECEQRGRIVRIPRAERSLCVIAPLSLDEARPTPDLLSTFSDVEIAAEACRRGLMRFAAPAA